MTVSTIEEVIEDTEFNLDNKKMENLYKQTTSSMFGRKQVYVYLSKEHPCTAIFTCIAPEDVFTKRPSAEISIHMVTYKEAFYWDYINSIVDISKHKCICINLSEFREWVKAYKTYTEINAHIKTAGDPLECIIFETETSIYYVHKIRKIFKVPTEVRYNGIYGSMEMEWSHITDIYESYKINFAKADECISDVIDIRSIGRSDVTFIRLPWKSDPTKFTNIPYMDGSECISNEYAKKYKGEYSLKYQIHRYGSIIRTNFIYKNEDLDVFSFKPSSIKCYN